MKKIIILFFSLLSLLKCAEEEESGLTILTDSNFDEFVAKNEFLLIIFYAPDCDYCIFYLSILEKASTGLRKNGIIPAQIDGTSQKKISEKYNIYSYPKIKFFKKNSEPINYNGGREINEIIDWCIRRKKNAYEILLTKNDIEKLKNENNITIIYFGNNESDERYFTRVAYFNTKYKFGQVKNEKLAKEYNVKNGSVIMFKNYDDERVYYNGEIDQLNKWISLNVLPKVKNFKEEFVYNFVFGNSKESELILFTNENENSKIEEYKKILYDVNIKIKGKLLTIITDIKSGNGKKAGDIMGIKESDLPQVRIINTTQDYKKYVMKDEINTKNIIKFYNDYENGKLEIFYKSQDVPKENNGDVFILVGDTFKKEVIENDKDVMVLFYAPWCDNCKAFFPIYEKIAKKLKEKNPKLLFAKIDATENEIKNIKITKYPTLKFYVGNKKRTPITYKRNRSEQNIIGFIRKYCYNELISDEDEENPDL